MQRSINTITVKSYINTGGVCIYDYDHGEITIGIYTLELDNEMENYLMFQSETKYYKLDTPTEFRILMQDNSIWDLDSKYSDANDFSPNLHRVLFRLNKDYFNKLESTEIKKIYIKQRNRNVILHIREEDQIRIKRMVTMHRILQQVYFIEKIELP